MRAVWTGYISFGLVNIPVRAIPARVDHDIHLEGLHVGCGCPVKMRKMCPCCHAPAPLDELVRGFPISGGRHVPISADDLARLGSPAKKTLSLLDFVDMAQVDATCYEKPYFLQPGLGGERPYALLVRTLGDTEKVGLGKVALRDREHLALIRTVRHALVMHLIGFPDEVRRLEDAVPPREHTIDRQALELMRLLIEAMTVPFDGARYPDSRLAALRALLDRKITEAEDTERIVPEIGRDVSALMEMLRRQLAIAAQ